MLSLIVNNEHRRILVRTTSRAQAEAIEQVMEDVLKPAASYKIEDVTVLQFENIDDVTEMAMHLNLIKHGIKGR